MSARTANRTRPGAVLLALLTLLALVAAACGGDDGGTSAAADETSDATTTAPPKPVTVKLGYFPNITHAPALVGAEGGLFADALGQSSLKTFAFNAGPEASEALLSGAIDATYIGPNPAINAWSKSKAIKIVAGATSGGALFVTTKDIVGVGDLKGKTIATPQLGNTQDVALRWFLKESGLNADTSGGGDVSIKPQSNATTLEQFKAGQIDGAWVPEPWATRLLLEGNGKVFLDEKQAWPDGRFVTTHLIVRKDFLDDHPDVVAQLLQGHLRAQELIAKEPGKAKDLVDRAIRKLTGTNITAEQTDAAWPGMDFTSDPVSSSLKGSAEHAIAVGLLPADTDLDGIYDLRILNKLLRATGQQEVKGF